MLDERLVVLDEQLERIEIASRGLRDPSLQLSALTFFQLVCGNRCSTLPIVESHELTLLRRYPLSDRPFFLMIRPGPGWSLENLEFRLARLFGTMYEGEIWTSGFS